MALFGPRKLPPRPGERRLSDDELRRMLEELAARTAGDGDPTVPNLGDDAQPPAPRLIARITDVDTATTPPPHAWEFLVVIGNDGTIDTDPSGFAGDFGNIPAFELNGQTVAIDTIVELFPADGNFYWFTSIGVGLTTTENEYRTDCINGWNERFKRTKVFVNGLLTEITDWEFDSLQGCCICPPGSGSGAGHCPCVASGTYYVHFPGITDTANNPCQDYATVGGVFQHVGVKNFCCLLSSPIALTRQVDVGCGASAVIVTDCDSSNPPSCTGEIKYITVGIDYDPMYGWVLYVQAFDCAGTFFIMARYAAASWNCNTDLTMTLTGVFQHGIEWCANWPTTIVVSRSAGSFTSTCSGSGSGTGSGGGPTCCLGACDPGQNPHLVGTVTAPTGCFVGLPATIDFECVTHLSIEHNWDSLTNLSAACGMAGNQGVMNIACPTPTTLRLRIFKSPLLTNTNADAGYTCSPLSAVFHVNDGGGNTFTLTVVQV